MYKFVTAIAFIITILIVIFITLVNKPEQTLLQKHEAANPAPKERIATARDSTEINFSDYRLLKNILKEAPQLKPHVDKAMLDGKITHIEFMRILGKYQRYREPIEASLRDSIKATFN